LWAGFFTCLAAAGAVKNFAAWTKGT